MPNSVALPFVVEIGWLHIPNLDHQFMYKSLISMLSSVTRRNKCYIKKFLLQSVFAAIAVLFSACKVLLFLYSFVLCTLHHKTLCVTSQSKSSFFLIWDILWF